MSRGKEDHASGLLSGSVPADGQAPGNLQGRETEIWGLCLCTLLGHCLGAGPKKQLMPS